MSSQHILGDWTMFLHYSFVFSDDFFSLIFVILRKSTTFFTIIMIIIEIMTMTTTQIMITTKGLYKRDDEIKQLQTILNRIELCHTTVLLQQIFGQVLCPSSGKKWE